MSDRGERIETQVEMDRLGAKDRERQRARHTHKETQRDTVLQVNQASRSGIPGNKCGAR